LTSEETQFSQSLGTLGESYINGEHGHTLISYTQD